MNGEIVFTRGVPPAEALPTVEMAECFDAVCRAEPSLVFQYGKMPAFRGVPKLRKVIGDWYGARDEEVLVSNGGLQIVDLLAVRLLGPGSVVFTERPSYDRAVKIFERRGAEVVGIRMESDGISIPSLTRALKNSTPEFLYLIPDFQNPAGATLSFEKRKEVLGLAEEHGFWVVEDIPYRELRYRGEEPPLLRDISPERTITVGSFSKIVCPGVRVGYALGEAELLHSLALVGEDTYLSPVIPTQAAVAEYVSRGLLKSNIAKLKALYQPRWRMMLDAIRRFLPGAQMIEPDGGFFASVVLPEDANVDRLVNRAAEAELKLSPGRPFFPGSGDGEDTEPDRFLRLAFHAVTPEEIEEGIQRLSTLV